MYERLGGAIEAKGADAHGDEMLDRLTGRVIEVGAGHGLNFGHYPPTVTEVVAVEPEDYLRDRAEAAGARAAVPIRVVTGAADRLPADDGEFDAGVASLVLCSVPDQASALDELRRVIRPGGELRFYEHVVSSKPRLARVQRGLDRTVWPRLGGGCHAARDTLTAIEAAGFTVERCRRFEFRPNLVTRVVAPHMIGVARRP
jgi:ubiquinone/menaquinone biosynthesis C-methylase UbiE